MKLKFTIFIVVSNLVIFSITSQYASTANNLIKFGGLFVYYGHSSALWRVVTYGFIHRTISTLLFNMIFGGLALAYMEYTFGTKKAITIYMSSVIIAGLAYLQFKTGYAITTGASGGMYGTFGALFVFTIISNKLNIRLLHVLTFCIIWGMSTSYIQPIAINYIGHTAGILAGLCLGLVFKIYEYKGVIQWHKMARD